MNIPVIVKYNPAISSGYFQLDFKLIEYGKFGSG